MLHHPQLGILPLKHSLVNGVRKLFGLKIEVVIHNCGGNKKSQIPSMEEVCFYLRESIIASYKLGRPAVTEVFKYWIKKGIKFDFHKLPENIQKDTAESLLKYPNIQIILAQIFTHLPTK